MVDPILLVATATAGLGLWELLTGRPLFGRPGWIRSATGVRLVGAYSLALSLVVVTLLVTRPGGLPFLTFGIGVLILGATVQIVRRRNPSF
ncbi:MAG: hypothetical protein M3Q90_05800 [Candidatus Dormibacteraeota bacterium]|nr:hypothetical protein [Candidatus Dormibacteraeota bacterium]